MTDKSPVSIHADGIELTIKATPRAAKAGIAGIAMDAAGEAWLAVKVTAPPDGGRANEAVLRLLAKALGVPASACHVAAGASSRWKRVRVAGDPAALAERAAALAARPGGH